MKNIVLWIVGLIGVDQGTKWLARESLDVPVQVTEWFDLHLAFNKGVAFSLPVSGWLLIVLTIGFVVWFWHHVFWSQNRTSKVEEWAAVFIISGAIGNLIDRVWFGQVTDFLSFWSFPIFNIADSLITVGVLLMIWSEMFGKGKVKL